MPQPALKNQGQIFSENKSKSAFVTNGMRRLQTAVPSQILLGLVCGVYKQSMN
jgi:hypothetical protein